MDEVKNKSDKESTPTDCTDSKPLNVDLVDPDTLVGLAALSSYFGLSIEKDNEFLTKRESTSE